MRYILSFLIFILVSGVVFSDHKPWENRISHGFDELTEDSTWGTAIDKDPGEILRSRSRTSAKNDHDENSHRWTTVSNVKCSDVAYRGNWGFSNYVPHEIENVRGSKAGTFNDFKGYFYKNSRVVGKVFGATLDCRMSISSCGASGSITAWKKVNDSGSSVIWAVSSIPW
ncbi:MAG: hypothetical protein OXM61_03040 [Candidatus Poribacteria bacterium]|nr:hypothetical protein [Candidatus Poribacteria bacterium]